MTLPRLALSVIGDEIGPSLEEMISFAHEHGLKRLDMRTVDGRNLLGMTKDEIITISRTLEKAGLTVPTFVSPLFKWPAPGKSPAGGKVDFAFDPTQCPAEDRHRPCHRDRGHPGRAAHADLQLSAPPASSPAISRAARISPS